MVQIIALDPGYGSTKVAINGKTGVVQTAVSHPKDIGLSGIGMQSAGRYAHDVVYHGTRFSVGTGSWHKGDPLTSMDYTALVSPERMAAFFTALALATREECKEGDGLILDEVMLVIGLPVPLLQDKVQAQIILDALRNIKGEHIFSVDTVPFRVNIERIKYLAQPVGAYINWFLDDELKARPGARKAEVAILDWGMNTLDEYVIQDAQVVEAYVGGAEIGVKRLLETIPSGGHDLVELDAKLRTGQLEIPDAQLDAWVSEFIAHTKRIMPNLKRFDVVIPVGGGTLVAGDRLRDALVGKGANVHWTEDPITENVRGLSKWAYENSDE